MNSCRCDGRPRPATRTCRAGSVELTEDPSRGHQTRTKGTSEVQKNGEEELEAVPPPSCGHLPLQGEEGRGYEVLELIFTVSLVCGNDENRHHKTRKPDAYLKSWLTSASSQHTRTKPGKIIRKAFSKASFRGA